MPNHRMPDVLKVLKGTYQPCRAVKTLPDGMKPLPEPPRRLPAHIRTVWREIARQAPHLRSSDKMIVEILCYLIYQQRTDPDMPAARISLLRHVMADCYLTPSTRHHIPPEPDPDDEF